MKHSNKNQAYNDNWFDFGNIGSFGWVWGMLVFVALASLIIWGVFLRGDSGKLRKALARHDDTVLVETLTRLPKGPYLHRVVDKELNRVCYLNAAGGGIVCYDLDDVTFSDEKLKEDLTKYHNGWRRYGYHNYNGTTNSNYYHGSINSQDDDH